MAGIQRFEDIKAWQKERELCRLFYGYTSSGAFGRDYGSRDQIRRAAVSIVSNIAEGFERQNDCTFVRYLHTARGSAAEVRARAYVALDQGYVTKEQFQTLYALSFETSRMLTGFIRCLSNPSKTQIREHAEPYLIEET